MLTQASAEGAPTEEARLAQSLPAPNRRLFLPRIAAFFCAESPPFFAANRRLFAALKTPRCSAVRAPARPLSRSPRWSHERKRPACRCHDAPLMCDYAPLVCGDTATRADAPRPRRGAAARLGLRPEDDRGSTQINHSRIPINCGHRGG